LGAHRARPILGALKIQRNFSAPQSSAHPARPNPARIRRAPIQRESGAPRFPLT